MGRDYSGANRDRTSRSRDDDDQDYASSTGEHEAPPRSPRSRITPPNRGASPRSGVSGRGSVPSDPGASSGRRSGLGAGGLIRPPLAGANLGTDDARRSGPPSSAGRGGPRSVPEAPRGGPRSIPESVRGGNGGARQRDDDYRGAEAPARGQRRSMASMARDVSRTMSRQLSVMMSRVGRTVRQDDSRVSRVAPPSPRRTPVPPEVAAEVAARPYRRSRARMIAAKWRRGRVRPNPIAIAVGAMMAILAAVVVLVDQGSVKATERALQGYDGELIRQSFSAKETADVQAAAGDTTTSAD